MFVVYFPPCLLSTIICINILLPWSHWVTLSNYQSKYSSEKLISLQLYNYTAYWTLSSEQSYLEYLLRLNVSFNKERQWNAPEWVLVTARSPGWSGDSWLVEWWESVRSEDLTVQSSSDHISHQTICTLHSPATPHHTGPRRMMSWKCFIVFHQWESIEIQARLPFCQSSNSHTWSELSNLVMQSGTRGSL